MGCSAVADSRVMLGYIESGLFRRDTAVTPSGWSVLVTDIGSGKPAKVVFVSLTAG